MLAKRTRWELYQFFLPILGSASVPQDLTNMNQQNLMVLISFEFDEIR